jgi:diguanylate cyclase (GGDEF)-like protein
MDHKRFWPLWWAIGLLAVATTAAAIPTATSASAGAQGVSVANGQESLTQYKVDGWQTEQGLPLNTVQSLLQARDDSLWVGTGAGLARFDGVRFTTYESTKFPGVSSLPIYGLMEDADGTIWIGHGKGAALYRNGVFESAFPAEVTASRRVWAFAQAADGVIWAASENGLVRIENGATRLYQVQDGLPTNRLRSLAFATDGTLWIGTTGGGLVSFADGRFSVLNPANGFPHLEVRFVLADPQGGVWAATAGGGLAHVNGADIKVYTVADGLPTDQLTALALDRHGALWIATWGEGISRLSKGRFTSVSSSGGLAGNQIWTLVVDREDSVWVGTWVDGLNRLSKRAFLVLGTPEGLSQDNVRSVVHGANGVTWIATAGGGLNRIEGQRITAIGRAQGLPTREISTVMEARDAALWIGTYTAGAVRLKDGRSDVYGVSGGLPSVDVRALYQDRSGTVWAGTTTGLARFNGKRFEAVHADGKPLEGVVAILQDRGGTLWFGTPGSGLYRYRDGAFTRLTRADGLVSNWIMALHEDAQGSLWIGTNGEGINRLHEGRLSAVQVKDGLWDSLAQVILEDRLGYLWMTTNRGFYRVALAELNAFADGRVQQVTSTGFGPGDALRSTTFAGGHQAAGAIDADGRLWLPSFKGLVIVDPARLPRSGTPPAVSVDDVLLDGVPVSWDAGVVLPSESVALGLHYRARTLLNPERVRFRYQMQGLGGDWVDVGHGRQVNFPVLPHGNYLFRVSASFDGVRWGEPEAALAITVRPYVHQTLWFRVLVVCGMLAIVALLFWLRTHQLRARHAEMEALVEHRTDELRLANERLSQLSFEDALTGLANRRRFDEALEVEWRRAARLRTPLALVMADVDHFKAYNDSLGHPQGDKCLAAVAGVFLRSLARAGDVAARYGGEEFLVLIPGADDEGARAFAEKLRRGCEALAIPHPTAPSGQIVTISLGVASCIPSRDNTAGALLVQVDAALYRAKQAGRNRVL